MKIIHINDVHIHIVKISDEMGKIDFYLSTLNKAELEKANRFYKNELTQNYIVCRGFLRAALSEYIKLTPDLIQFKYNPYGKPEMIDSINKENYTFNLSHSGDYCILGVTREKEVGIDIEEKKDLRDYLSISKSFFTEKEVKSIHTIDHFYSVWSQKEALIKATGMGLSFGLNHWSAVSDDNEYRIEIKSHIYWIRKLELVEGYSSAVCLQM